MLLQLLLLLPLEIFLHICDFILNDVQLFVQLFVFIAINVMLLPRTFDLAVRRQLLLPTFVTKPSLFVSADDPVCMIIVSFEVLVRVSVLKGSGMARFAITTLFFPFWSSLFGRLLVLVRFRRYFSPVLELFELIFCFFGQMFVFG